ncbi:MAG: hypothetical protein AB1500_02470 [Bacillota bacterium]
MQKESITAHFRTRDEAEHAANRLKAMGVNDIQIERTGKTAKGGLGEVMGRITGSISGLGDYVMGANREDDDRAEVRTAPDAADEDLARRDVILKANVDETLRDKVLQILKESGGTV